MIKAALVGAGGIGKVHYDAYQTLDNVKLVAAVDPYVDSAREKLGDADIPIYADLAELFANEQVDMVDLCIPSTVHMKTSIQALEKGVHVLCEKPMSISSEDTGEAIEIAKKCGKKFMIAHVVRFMAPYMYLKSVIDSRELGKIVNLDMKRLSPIPISSRGNWMHNLEKSGGTPMDLSIHDIDFVNSVFGEPKQVMGAYRKLKDGSDCINSILVYDDFAATISGAWFNYRLPFTDDFLAVFENGTVERKSGKVYKNGEEVDLDSFSITANTGVVLDGKNGYADEIKYFVSCIETGKQPEIVTPESSESTIKLVERIVNNSAII